MATHIQTLNSQNREEIYIHLVPQIKNLISGEQDTIANMANISAALKYTFNFLWVGFYIVKKEELVLGPFQGKVACTRIRFGKGVCGTAWKESRTVIVPDVNCFEGHIACDSESFSEIVVPIFLHDNIIGVLDIDSEHKNYFSETDANYLEEIVKLLVANIEN